MGKINLGRVLLGAVLWWLVVMVLGLPGWLIYGDQWTDAMLSYGREFPNPEFIAVFCVGVLALGVLAMWLYASIRPRYGPGPKTALLAGLAVWLALSVADTMWGEMRFLPRHLIAVAIAAYLVIIVVATIAGAWLYKEAD